MLKGRTFCGEEEYDSDDTALADEVDDSADTMRRLATPIVSPREQSGSGQLVDTSTEVEEPRQRRRRKKRSTVEPLCNTKAQEDAMDTNISTVQREPSGSSKQRQRTSRDSSSKFFPMEREPGKKRKRESADEANLQEKREPKKEGKRQKSMKTDSQASANRHGDQGPSPAHSVPDRNGDGKDGKIAADTHAATGDIVEGEKDADTEGDKAQGVTMNKNKEKRKKRRDRSKGLEAIPKTESTNAPENLSNIIAIHQISEVIGPSTAENITGQEVNEPLPEQLSVAVMPVESHNNASDHLSRSAIKAARRLRKQEKRRAAAMERKDDKGGAALSPPMTKRTTPNQSRQDLDDHPVNQITGLPAPSINELKGIPGSSNKHSSSNAAPTAAHGPNDPKTAAEARRNLEKSAEQDADNDLITANINNESQLARTTDALDRVAQLDALKDCSKKKQVELFDQGQFEHPDKQVPDEPKEMKHGLQLEKDAEKHQVDAEHARRKRRKKRKSETEKEDAVKDDDGENVKTKKVKHVKTEEDLTPREPDFQSPMIQ